MGSLVSLDQVKEVRERVQELSKTASIVYGDLDKNRCIGADAKGAFLAPILLREDNPFKNLQFTKPKLSVSEYNYAL